MKKVLLILCCLVFSLAGCAPAAASSFTPSNGWWRTMLTQDGWNNEGCYLTVHREKDYTSASANGIFEEPEDYSPTLSYPLILNTAKEAGSLGDLLDGYSFYNLFTPDDEQYIGQFYEKGISLTSPKGETVFLTIAEKDYKQIKKNLEELFNTDRLNISSLTSMNWKECKNITVTSSDGLAEKIYTDHDMAHGIAFAEFPYIIVEPNSCIKVQEKELKNAAHAILNFDDGTYIEISITDDLINVFQSEANQILQYKLLRESKYQTTLDIFNEMANGFINPRTAKPVIYLYPEKPTDVNVQLTFHGKLTYTYPAYNNGWNVTAYPDGRILNKSDGSEHYYLFWEGMSNQQWDFSKGFVVAGKDTEAFLKKSLVQLGLTPKEYNDFLVFWVPRMQDNAYNLITFATDQYEELAPLKISPKPDSILRVHMVYKPLDKPMAVEPQKLSGFARKGFTVVEWGGTEVK